jgi:hypothetical protein
MWKTFDAHVGVSGGVFWSKVFLKKPFINKRDGYIRMKSKFDAHAVRNRNHLLLQFRSIPNETLREAHLLLRPPYAAKNIVEGQGHRPISDNE